MYELAVHVGPGCRGSLDEFENKTLYALQELIMLLRIYIEFLVTTWNYKYHKFEPVCNKFYFQRLSL